ncbi:MAG: RluA family pseudouridine synthase [Pseudomonadota bacterium]
MQILYAAPEAIVVVKPAGLLSVPGKSQPDCLFARLAGADPEVRQVHRLDMDTSGVMVFARTANSQKFLGRQFEKRRVAKTYVACVAGIPDRDSGHIDLPLGPDWPNRPRQMVDYVGGRPARTRWQVVDRAGNCARVTLTPETGRSHQLRVHMAAIGHPILGDAIYGDAGAAPRLMLHAQTLAFVVPGPGTWQEFTAPSPF